jgi:tetratricopeptide (TPR) repeat protein
LTVARSLAACAATLLVSACAHVPPAPVELPTQIYPTEVSAARSELQSAYQRRRTLALKYENAGDLLNASRQWQVVLVIAPGDQEATSRLGNVQSALTKLAADEMSAAREALRRSDLDKAQRSLLRVLALDAYHDAAVNALREIDRQRAVRLAADRAARARAEEPGVARKRSNQRPRGEAVDYDIEQSLELLRAGDVKVALAELHRYVAANPRDGLARERIAGAVRGHAQQLERQGDGISAVGFYAEAIRLHPVAPKEWVAQLARMRSRLAGDEYEKGVRVIGRDLNAAIVHFESALRLSPDHIQAQLQLERARKMQKNLGEIPSRPR